MIWPGASVAMADTRTLSIPTSYSKVAVNQGNPRRSLFFFFATNACQNTEGRRALPMAYSTIYEIVPAAGIVCLKFWVFQDDRESADIELLFQ